MQFFANEWQDLPNWPKSRQTSSSHHQPTPWPLQLFHCTPFPSPPWSWDTPYNQQRPCPKSEHLDNSLSWSDSKRMNPASGTWSSEVSAISLRCSRKGKFSFKMRLPLVSFLIHLLIIVFTRKCRRRCPCRLAKMIRSSGSYASWMHQCTWLFLHFTYRFMLLARNFLPRCSFCCNPVCPRKSLSWCTLFLWIKAATREGGLTNV